MAIVCDRCQKNLVSVNGQICDECLRIEADSKIDKTYLNKIYLPSDLFDKFERLHNSVISNKSGSKKALSKFMRTLRTSFLNRKTGKELNDPTPKVIQPSEKTLDRVEKILNHNLRTYAALHDMDTPEDLDDWTVSDMMSDEWEQSLYQYVESVEVMEPDEPDQVSGSVQSSTSEEVIEETNQTETD